MVEGRSRAHGRGQALTHFPQGFFTDGEKQSCEGGAGGSREPHGKAWRQSRGEGRLLEWLQRGEIASDSEQLSKGEAAACLAADRKWGEKNALKVLALRKWKG